MFGAVIGSFLNVCIYRIPREKSIIHPPSSCPNCGRPVKFYDNIPLASYVLMKGRCRSCGVRISAKYPIVEALTALLFVVLYTHLGLTFELFVFMTFTSVLIVISFIDLEFKIIPDILSIGGIIAGLVFSIARPFFRNFGLKFDILDSIYGILLGGGIIFAIAWIYQLIAKRKGMGGGDIKLLAMIGAFCGLKGALFSLICGSMAGIIVGVPLMLAKGENGRYAIPFGPFLSIGAFVYLYTGERVIFEFLEFLDRG
jgi:leader peptidase (prepilin peptidase)/N-methyltransferase